MSTDPGDRSASEIEREVDRERARVAGTIDALQEKMSVSGVIDQVVQSVSEHGGDVSRNLARTMRDNPMPVILTTVGLAWLMMSSGSETRRAGRYDLYDDEDWDRDYLDRPGSAAYPVTDYDEGVAADPSFGAASTPYAGGLDDTGTVGGSAYVGSAGSSGEGRLAKASGAAKDRASAVMEGGRDRAQRAREGLQSAADRAREGMGAAGDRARSAASDARYRAQRGGRAARDSFENLLEDQPLVVGALALALGAAFGSALPRTRTEDDLMGEQADRVKDQLTTAARDNVEKAKAVGAAVADEALKMGDEAAAEMDKNTPRGADIADSAKSTVEQAAERLRKRGEEEAQRQGLTGGDKSKTT